MMCALIEDLLPPSYFSSTLLGIQTDQRVLRQLIVQYLPALDRLLQEHDIGEDEVIPLCEGGMERIVAPVLWQQHRNCAYCKGFPLSFFRIVSDYAALVPHLICQRGRHPFAPPYLGPALLPRLTGALPDHSGHAENPGKLSEIISNMAMMMMMMMILATVATQPQEEELISSENSASIFNTLSDLPSQLRDGAELLGEAMRLAGTLSQETLEAQRHKHLAYILSEQTQLNNGNSVPLNTNLNKVSCGCRLSRLSGFLLLLRVEQCWRDFWVSLK